MISRILSKPTVSFLLYFLIFTFLPSCSTRSRIVRKRVFIIPKKQKITSQAPSITVWIHGTRLLRRPMYYRYFNGKPHLKHAKQLPKKYHLSKVADLLCAESPYFNADKHFYTFGWSGKLNAREREQAAFILLKELHELKKKYEALYSIKPKIRIIAHSHGGNLALNLAKISQQYPDYTLSIDQLILLACPVQNHTCMLIQDPMFKQIYALYSTLDVVQIIAPEICYIASTKSDKFRRKLKIPPLSERRFPPHPRLAQVKIKINGHALWHADFVGATFLRSLDSIIQEIDRWKNENPHFVQSNKPHLLAVYNT